MALAKPSPTTLRLLLNVKPNARVSCVTAVTSGAVSVRIATPPRRGEANAEVAELVAGVLGRRKSDVAIVRGAKSREKVVEVQGVSDDVEVVRAVLEAAVKN